MNIANMNEYFKDDPLEYKRQSGRTTRMFGRAIKAVMEGKQVVVVMKDLRDVNLWKEKVGDVPRLSIEGMKVVPTPEINWMTFKLVGLRSDHELFIDHDVFESTYRNLLKAWTADDLPVSQLRQFQKE